ncbi:hypothetical protein B0H15DRAFT_894514 [Mycena belliarum]|uniref:C2H2-type domain-containing protein n=1 Tax=Mycena belliarum TaxID=1033014 RepID=A0AAD6TNX1_9AGAR|nr:hypothetical protein B0H15DRAFT_894514 [Mycena belliae]
MATAEGGLDSEPELEIIDLTGDATSESEDGQAEREEDPDTSFNGLDEASRARLHAAIFTVPEARLRDVLAGLIDSVPAVYHALARELVVNTPITRVVVPRWETCANCRETYDVHDDEGEEECVFHPGDLQVNEAMFGDHDEDRFGPMDSTQMRDRHPENFAWSCCSGNGLTEGCVTSRHAPASHKKQRL